ncbi:LysM peptidoglycan-binding domain-containing protein [Sphingomonas panacisoli]|uniref:LysM peptidoglycan-binding domain-containing protein n=1 Tax=Sphingomonas panacisoli TaxID=1813879 RepID=A0A5B8LLC1_9SPHN|nr:LysM peptidoglycan-binding domain-containing protein [Sphingomonas panacisoli]QDZ08374.1 LysM peptidoglycan-binding domain-containing protein [Sphingomonas panacisoli]
MSMRIGIIAAGLGASVLAGCGGPSRVNPAPTPPTAGVTAANETELAFGLLMQGKEGSAAGKLKSILKRDPMNPTATMLAGSIKGDPKDLLGPQSYPYTVRAGDTMEGLAQRFLGNRLKAYQLVRYNGLRAPVTLAGGQMLRIPGEPPRPEPVRRAEPEPARPVAAPAAPKPRVVAVKPAAPATNPGTNPVAARQLRTAGLAALNQGGVDRAVGLLRRAKQLDPSNPLIARDLTRAERIAATVRARK